MGCWENIGCNANDGACHGGILPSVGTDVNHHCIAFAALLGSLPVRILITNDDGLRSPGIHALHEVAQNYGDAIIVAPDRDRSGVSAAITLSEPLRVREVGRPDIYEVVSGTPTDCVYVGINHVLRDNPPDLVLSGINPGPNLGWDVLYSGTVAGAREGVLQGLPAAAFSLMPGPEMPYDEIKP
ncbi:MAG TPA: 5'/3'-nucleotidase SurE [Myxococcales bacterium]|nr:5'/3'-nucleotidase SurE [Myxococcales bacterium]